MSKKCPTDLKWAWQRVMDWYGGEGSVYVEPYARYLSIAQKDRKILDQICQFLRGQGLKTCPIYYDKKKDLHRIRIERVEDLRTFIKKGRPYAPTEKACNDLDRLEEGIKEIKPRRVYRPRRKSF